MKSATDIPWGRHTLTLEKGVFHCVVCGREWKKGEPPSQCPCLPVYSYRDWSHGLLTKKQLGEKGFQTGKSLPAPVGLVPRDESPNGYIRLYNPETATPKRKVSEEEKVKRAEQRKAASLCPRCKERSRAWTRYTRHEGKRGHVSYWSNYGWWDYCEYCEHEVKLEDARAEAAQWSCDRLTARCLILDCETSGLGGAAEILEIAVINAAGNVLLNTRIKPQNRNYTLESGAYGHNGIHPDELDNCPPFAIVWDTLVHLLSGKQVVIYNAQFDVERLRADCRRLGLPRIKFKPHCAMLAYAKYCGQWSEYHESFTWQELPGGDHTALGDSLATLDVLREMAKG